MGIKFTSCNGFFTWNIVNKLLSTSQEMYQTSCSIAGYCIKTISNNLLFFEALKDHFGAVNNIEYGVADYELVFLCTSTYKHSYTVPRSWNIIIPYGRYSVMLSLGSTIYAELRDEVDYCVCGIFQAGIDKAIVILSESYNKINLIRDILLALLGSATMGFFRSKGLAILHAAGVVFDDSAILIAGDSGSGKSTTSLILSSAGYDWLCDDLALISLKNGVFIAFGLPSMIGIPNICIHQIKGLCDLNKSSHLESCKATTRDVLYAIGGKKAIQASPSVIIFPEIQPQAKCEIFPLETNVVTEKILQFDGFFFSEAHKINSVSTLLALNKQVNSYRLIIGKDVWNLTSLLDNLIKRGSCKSPKLSP